MTLHQSKFPRAIHRVFMLALDSLSLPFIRSHLDRLPTLARLIEESSLCRLPSSGDFASASVWPSLCLGIPPGEHGQYFPFQWDAEGMSFRRTDRGDFSRRFCADPFWFELARQGIKSVVLDPGQIQPTTETPCVQVLNWSYQSTIAASSNPPELVLDLQKRFGKHPMGREVPIPKGRRHCRIIRDSLQRAVRAKSDAIILLAETQTWQFFFAGMYEFHRAGHNLWPDTVEFGSNAEPDALLDVYREGDRQLERILRCVDLDQTAVVIVSPNGMGSNRAQSYFLPQILSRLNAAYLEKLGNNRAARKDHFNLIAVLRDKVPYSAQYWAATLLGESVQDWVVNRTFIGGLDWQRTLAFTLPSGGEGLIRLNLKGRERLGSLDQSEAESFVRWLKHELSQIRVASSHQPLVANIIDVRQQCPGPRAEFLPDLALTWAPNKPETQIYSPTIGKVQARLTTGRGGNHTYDSFALLSGAVAGDPVASKLQSIEDLSRLPAHWLRLEEKTQCASLAAV